MLMRPFEEYSTAYPNVEVKRDANGVLELRMHTGDGPLLWGQNPHGQLTNLYVDIAHDDDNKIIILTGTGDDFISGMKASRIEFARKSEGDDHYSGDPELFSLLHYQGKQLMQSILDIEVPMIAAVNGPVGTHSEQALLCDIVLASDTATFADAVHFAAGMIPGDGVHVIYHEAMGLNRARYFLLTGEEINAQQALEWGLVNEVMPAEKLLPRARELATKILEKPPMVVRLTRQILVHDLKKRMLDELSLGLALEHWAISKFFPTQS